MSNLCTAEQYYGGLNSLVSDCEGSACGKSYIDIVGQLLFPFESLFLSCF